MKLIERNWFVATVAAVTTGVTAGIMYPLIDALYLLLSFAAILSAWKVVQILHMLYYNSSVNSPALVDNRMLMRICRWIILMMLFFSMSTTYRYSGKFIDQTWNWGTDQSVSFAWKK